MKAQNAQNVQRITLGVNELAAALGVSKPTVERLLRRKEIKSFKAGGRRLISLKEVEGYIERNQQETAAA